MKNNRQSTLPFGTPLIRAENVYSLVRYSTIGGWDALAFSLYCLLIVSEQGQGDVAQTSLLDSELPPACLVTPLPQLCSFFSDEFCSFCQLGGLVTPVSAQAHGGNGLFFLCSARLRNSQDTWMHGWTMADRRHWQYLCF